jgi:hypothetical protein
VTEYLKPTPWQQMRFGTSTLAENFRKVLAKQQGGEELTVQDKLILQEGARR